MASQKKYFFDFIDIYFLYFFPFENLCIFIESGLSYYYSLLFNNIMQSYLKNKMKNLESVNKFKNFIMGLDHLL